VVTNNVASAMLAKDPYEIKVAIGYMNNFVFSATGAQRWEKALEELPFLAHITTHASEMTQYADIVLPSTITMFEKLGYTKTKANGYGCQAAVGPPHGRDGDPLGPGGQVQGEGVPQPS
jgi:anaerobic selenocysteine-containing dehydrogenase